MERVHHVVFNDDIDGIISTAIYLHDFIRTDTYRLYPVSTTNKGEKFEALVKSMRLKPEIDFLVILNYENHRRSNLWIDHHWSKIMGDEPVKNNKIIYDPQSKSTARLVHEMTGPKAIIQKYSEKFLNMVDTIGKSDYKSVTFIFNDTHPLMILRAYIERSHHSEMMFGRIIEMISGTHFDFRKTLYQLRLNRKIIWDLKKEAEKVRREILIIGSFSVIRQSRPGKFPRYSEFYIIPKIKYSLRFSTISKEKVYFQIGCNKWHQEENDVDIGKMLSSMSYLIKGGGHYGAGGGIIEQEHCERFLDDLSLTLNKENILEDQNQTEGAPAGEPSAEHPAESNEMEKNGVDANDPVESEAAEKVASGEADNMSEGREQAAESQGEVPASEEASSEPASEEASSAPEPQGDAPAEENTDAQSETEKAESGAQAE
jgi:oligoribonuclease NrnB/cAMP/cGMP phosphodiesterase (DHH superfamily)